MEISNTVASKIRRIAKTRYPKECCGLLLTTASGEVEIFEGQNQASVPHEGFVLDVVSTLAGNSQEQATAVFHSHVDNRAEPSDLDRRSCFEFGIPWLIYCVPLDTFRWLQPWECELPLLGRAFHWGVLDCYTLVRDAYKARGVILPDYPRLGLMDALGKEDWDQFRSERWIEAGFESLELGSRLRKYDVIAMDVYNRPGIATHVALFWDEEKGSMIHHVMNRLSEPQVYGGYWQDRTVALYRHKAIK